ncbi:hypothetical protein AK830_g9877 [Neonectria ditissima]|uniref:Uncharacterized protein n=1 Tax=Neonectria ditissima TaxID=78410 RepID=A0A0P7B8H5_9HYPO|nr:hypothetical protein AK830_g9877 [Neonectria ditissima]
MNGSQPPESQKPPPASPAGTNGHNSNSSSSLAAKKRKKDGLKPIITMEGATTQTPGVPSVSQRFQQSPQQWQRAIVSASQRPSSIDGQPSSIPHPAFPKSHIPPCISSSLLLPLDLASSPPASYLSAAALFCVLRAQPAPATRSSKTSKPLPPPLFSRFFARLTPRLACSPASPPVRQPATCLRVFVFASPTSEKSQRVSHPGVSVASASCAM